jgi:CO dehydrogenase maturation factor
MASMSKVVDDEKRLVATCGKGGTGKTVSVALMARTLSEAAGTGKLLLIDADPAMGLLSALGVSVRRTMGEVREKIIRTARGEEKAEKGQLVDMIDYMALEALSETDRFAVLAMGRTETLGCYCPVNTLLRGAIEVLSKSFDTILIDGEAGLEQINRQVVSRLHTLLIVSDPTSRGLETARVIRKMVKVDKVMQCKRLGLVLNRVRGNEQLLTDAARKLDLDLFGMIPFDETIAEHDLVGTPIIELPEDSPALGAYRQIVEERLLI